MGNKESNWNGLTENSSKWKLHGVQLYNEIFTNADLLTFHNFMTTDKPKAIFFPSIFVHWLTKYTHQSTMSSQWVTEGLLSVNVSYIPMLLKHRSWCIHTDTPVTPHYLNFTNVLIFISYANNIIFTSYSIRLRTFISPSYFSSRIDECWGHFRVRELWEFTELNGLCGSN